MRQSVQIAEPSETPLAGNVIKVAAREVLMTRDYLFELAIALSALGLPRRQVLDWLADVIYGWLSDGGMIVDEAGDEILVHDEFIDDAHGDDPECTWISDQRRTSGVRPHRSPKRSLLKRLQVYDMAFKIVGLPVRRDDRRAVVRVARATIAAFTPPTKARYLNSARRLRRQGFSGVAIYHAAEMHRLRLRLSTEANAWVAMQGL